MRHESIKGAMLAICALGMVSSHTALASDLPPPAAWPTPGPAIETWSFSLTPYAWATSLNGSTTVKGRTIDINASFVDILNHTQFPQGLFELAAFGEARYGRFGILADVVYMKLGLDSGITKSRGVDRLNAAVGASAGLTIHMVIAELAAAYEIARWTSGPLPGQSALDLYAGARAWWQWAEANFALSGTVNIGDLTLTGDRTLSAQGSVYWVDPVIGARLRHRFSSAWELVVSGDVGGFGVGSKFSWQAIGALNYEFSRSKSVAWSGMLGYKALSVDYSQGSNLTHYEYDMVMHGPIFGVVARF